MYYRKQSLAHREINIPGAYIKNPAAKLPRPGQFNPCIFQPEPPEFDCGQALTVPNQLPAGNFDLPSPGIPSYFQDEEPTEFEWTKRVRMIYR